jgi:uncharacterized peroxidase-related enzyme
MPRIQPVDPANTEAKTHDLLEAVQKTLGLVPNLYRTAARSPAALEGLVALSGALARGAFRAGFRESIALAVAEANGCDYCLSAHSALGRGAGLSDEAIEKARRGTAVDQKTAAALGLARALVQNRGRISDPALDEVHRAGITDEEVMEVIANVVVNIFTNYVNIVAGTDIDFPIVRSGVPRAA